MKFYIHTFGCRVNWAESTALARQLKQKGLKESTLQEAKLVILNTCAVTQKAVREARQFIYAVKRKQKEVKIVATGCAATLWGQNNELIKGIDFLIDNSDKEFLASLLIKKLLFRQKQEDYFPTTTSGKFLNSGRLMVKVQTGCNYFCTFCIVPYLRGVSKSVTPQEVINYIKQIEKENRIQEAILTGINLGLYGTEWGIEFADLVEKVLNETAVKRISYGSIYVENISDKFLNLYKNRLEARLSRFFHIPLQSASEKILSLMRRRYTLAEFSEKINLLVKQVKDAFIATDIIVGFLEETDSDFERTYQYLKTSPIVRAHIFRFSKRPNTAAFYMAKRMSEPSEEIKKYRAEKLQKLFAKKLAAFKSKFIGSRQQALLVSVLDKKTYLGMLSNGLEVIILTDKKLENGIYNVKIDKAVGKNQRLIAKLVA